ncbi:MAG TPA: hypothetical protein DCE47_05165 [Planctomycetaceae bacterium]|nr:hypothetical protein [Planctomycetaceae bacterium]HCD03349.1 hypothetical protein [Planctomycetaceae bacterium]
MQPNLRSPEGFDNRIFNTAVEGTATLLRPDRNGGLKAYCRIETIRRPLAGSPAQPSLSRTLQRRRPGPEVGPDP